MRWPRIVAGLALLVAACAPSQPPPPEPTVEPPTANPTSAPRPVSPEEVAGDFLRLWQAGQYASMYDLLSSGAQATTPRELFVRRHTNIRDGIGETRLTAEQTDAATTSGEGEAAIVEVPIELRRSLAIFGDIAEPNALRLVQQRGAWKIDWDPGVIFTGLTATSTVRVTPEQPTRGRIVDRAGEPLADNGSILAIGVVPGEIKDEAALLSTLSEALNLPRETVKQRYQGGQPSWFMPIATRPQGDRPALESKLGGIGGVSMQSRPARVYPLGEAAAQLVGYVTHPTAEELKQAAVAGLDESDWIGRAGLEARAQETLGGAKGGVIHIVDQAGRVLRTVAQKPAVAGQDLILEVHSTVQRQAFEALAGQTGSVVVLDPRDNALRALVSVPSFDPNRFVVGLSDAEWQELNAPTRPLVLRASEAAYPTGSIFKPITMAAGLERGGFSPTQTFDCGRDWNGLPGQTLHNWEAQGTLTLTQALTQSCNPAFYEIGLSLDRMDPTLLPSYAQLFGLGQPTHAAGLFEVGGTVPTPEWKREHLRESWTSGDSVNLAIGQGYLLATPLQMANAYAALARGDGVLPPRLIAEPKPPRAEPGGLSVSAGTRAAIIEGMKRVTSTPRGTAAYAFQGERLSIAAKTGSAENENPAAHAWFVGFTPAENASLLVVVMVEGGQQGGTVAAPIARKVIDFAYAHTR